MKTLFTGLKKISMTAVLATSLAAGIPAISQATPILKYRVGSATPVSIAGTLGGLVSTPGWVITNGVSLNLAGTSKPNSGTAERPNIDLSTADVYNGTPSPIGVDVWLTDTDFASHTTPLALLSSYSVTLGSGATAEFWSYASESNNPFDTSPPAIQLNDSGLITAAGGFGNSYSTQTLADPFSLTLYAHFSLKSNKQATSSDQSISVPEPSILGMVGLGLLMVGLMGLRFRQARYRGDHSKA